MSIYLNVLHVLIDLPTDNLRINAIDLYVYVENIIRYTNISYKIGCMYFDKRRFGI